MATMNISLPDSLKEFVELELMLDFGENDV
jgi:hypothetical protein